MAWRFKASKYKNAAPIVPKFENTIRDLSIGCYRSHGNFIAASAAYMAFNWDIQGSNLAVLPVDAKGRQNKANVPLIYAHSEMVTDFKFSPFDDGLLATGSQDSNIKLWRIPSSGMPINGLCDPELVLPEQPRRIETVNFNPNVDSVLATSSFNSISVWDIIEGKEVFNAQDHEDEVQSVAWKQSGDLFASQSKDLQLRIFDVRSGSKVNQCLSHEGMKDSKVVWIGNSNRILTTGFSGERLREINIRDMRNLSVPQKNLTLDMSSGILVPLFDPDTNMCFLCGKGDRNIQFIEISENEPHIIEGLKYSGDQTKGACLVPKRSMDVMQGEVNRVLQLCDSSIVPVTWQVPRKSYREYHADIYPETFGLESAMGPENWLQGQNQMTPTINLDPKKRPLDKLVVFQDKPLKDRPRSKDMSGVTQNGSHSNGTPHKNGQENIGTKKDSDSSDNEFKKPNPKPRAVSRSNSNISENGSEPNIPPQVNKLDESPKPRPSPRLSSCNVTSQEPISVGHQSQSSIAQEPKIEPDEGLAMLRRQPSIRDRKRMLEQNTQKSQEITTTSSSNGSTTSRPPSIRERTPSDEENKENKLGKIPEKEMVKKSEEDDVVVELRSKNIFIANDRKSTMESDKKPEKKRPVSKMFCRVSKFKHLKGDVLIKGKFENLKNIGGTVPAECNFVHANADRIAVPLTGPGGKIALFETRKPGRIADGVTPVLINGTTVMDFAFDPFDTNRLVTACDDGHVRVWNIPKGGITHQVNKSDAVFPAHADKIQIVKFHPLAKDVIVTAAFDRTVKIWDLNNTNEPQIELEGHEDQLYSVEFSVCGRFLATVCRDGKIRLFDPRKGSRSILEGGEIIPKKGARVVWVLDGEYLIVTGFSRQSERQVMMYRTQDLTLVNSVTLDVSPAILVPYYDHDSSTLFLTGKGESTVTTFEVATDAPHLFPLSPYKPAGLHQGFAFLPKNVCNVRDVEFARAYRLTSSTIEPISFTVPRVKTAFFQDDLFPDTRVTWEPTISAEEWLQGSQKSCSRVSLKPDDMRNLSEGSGVTTTVTRTSAPQQNNNAIPNISMSGNLNSFSREMSKQKEQDIEKSVSTMMGDMDLKLEQDDMEGADEKDWEEEDDD
ncbi:coronin-7-like isoform X1 [Tigriopus californicus]|uniref:coronin-7-like isoform X1 n=1 Tax=Tigriopus californicus TaxID=6832 RepID=UPI0027DAA5B6|nr:coronin-7-like isoform X1 [Tigriopus californicus]XP_059078880.1 coronin-7-like isoform X1 [Tigriopus californicus]